MAISTYAELRSAVASWLERSDLTAVIPDFIALAQAKAYRGAPQFGLDPLRINAMVSSGPIAIVAGAGALPTRWLQFISLRGTGQDGPALEYAPPQSFWMFRDAYIAPSPPRQYTIEGQTLRVMTTGDTTVNAVWYAGFAPLVADGDADWVLANAPHVWLHGALAEAYQFTGDDTRRDRETAAFAAAVAGLNRQDWAAKTSGAPLRFLPSTVI